MHYVLTALLLGLSFVIVHVLGLENDDVSCGRTGCHTVTVKLVVPIFMILLVLYLLTAVRVIEPWRQRRREARSVKRKPSSSG
jgi:hypothetical protein